MMASEEKNPKSICNGKAPVLHFNNRILINLKNNKKNPTKTNKTNPKLIIQTKFSGFEWAKLTTILLHF